MPVANQDKDLELFRQHRAEQSKYAYFLLAAAASGIALSVRATMEAVLHWSLLPLAAAVLAWGFSFYYGCRHLDYVQGLTRTNAAMLQAERGEHPLAGPEPWKRAASVEVLKEILERDSTTAAKHYLRQFRLLLTGAVLFLGWHVTQIVLRSQQ
jgi:hypothetical protein